MSSLLHKDKNYTRFLSDLKSRIKSVQIKAAVAVNREMIELYWELADKITEKQKKAAWGGGFLEQIAKDLQDEFPDVRGFSLTNIKYMRQWFLFWNEKNEISQQLVGQLKDIKYLVTQIPWGHNLVIMSKSKNHLEAVFYAKKTIENNWSRAVLSHQIDNKLYEREGKALTNFSTVLPTPQSDLARQTLKDPYVFDFLSLREKYNEKELENELIRHVSKFLLELGAGFSYIGHQYKITVDEEDFYIDLLFYHTRMHCYVVVELKSVRFKPEFVGKLNFYVSAVDDILKMETDNPTVGILICKSKKKTVVEYSLKDMNKPIGVSAYEITRVLPEDLKSSLPTVEEIEAELEELE
ncbi:MAG: PDDEXK nuclease domain-containing protein [Thermotogota bacterium]|nr:PDDEXK nuclease domain-containing protein [Thermotogota bacterium]